MLARAMGEFGDVEWDGVKRNGGQQLGRTIGEMARSELDEIRRAAAEKQTGP